MAAIDGGIFGQNVFVTSSTGKYVLRGAALYAGQFAKEQYFAQVITEQTSVTAPWPYLVSDDESIFGWEHGFAIMPVVPGLQLSSKTVRSGLTSTDREKITLALAQTLANLHAVRAPASGEYNAATGNVEPFGGGFSAWFHERITSLAQQALTHGSGFTQEDHERVFQVLRDATDAIAQPFEPTLVLHDYKEGNVSAAKTASGYLITGVFDLEEAFFGDGDLDLVRQVAWYTKESMPHLAHSFIQTYHERMPLREGALARLNAYMLCDRLDIWRHFHSLHTTEAWPYPEQSFAAWVRPYIETMAKAAQSMASASK